MSFQRPTLPELVARTRADLRGRLDNLGALLRRAMPDVLAATWSGAVHMLHGHLDWVFRQLFPDKSDDDTMLRQAAMYGITPTAARFAGGPVLATGIDASIIANGEILEHALGQQYEVTNGPVTVTGGEAELVVTALIAGAAGNLDEGDTLTFESAPAGVDSEATIGTGGLIDGADEGTPDNTRQRLIERLQEPPAGGRDADYIAWAKLVSGVTRVWVYPLENGLGTVVIRFVMDDAEPIIPTGGDVTEVQASIDANRPITAEATVEAPVALPLDLTIALTPDTSEIREAVTDELRDILLRDGRPGDGAGAGTILLSHILGAIYVGVGDGDFVLTDPSADVVPALGELVTLGDITWA